MTKGASRLPRHAAHSHEPLLIALAQPLDGVTQGGAWHLRSMRVEKIPQRGFVALSHLAQHPPDRLVHQVFRVAQETLGHADRGRKVVVTDGPVRSHDRNASLPE